VGGIQEGLRGSGKLRVRTAALRGACVWHGQAMAWHGSSLLRGSRGRTAALLILFVLLLAGCGKRVPAASDLAFYANGLVRMDDVMDRFELRTIRSGATSEGVEWTVRKRNPFESASDREIADLKQAVYAEFGRTFPLDIRVWTLPQTPTLDGKITGLDADKILVVDTREDNGGEPRAMWLGAGHEDAVIADGVTGELISAAQLRIGDRVRAWSDFNVLTSYPEQSNLLRLEVMDRDPDQGDLAGTLEKIEIGADDPTEREVQIDGVRYPLLRSARIVFGGREGRLDELKAGERVRVWFAGYEVIPGRKMVSQIAVD